MNGKTPFFGLPYFNYTKHVGIDALHNVILGFVKEVSVEILLPIVKSGTKENEGKVQRFDQAMRRTQIPADCVRLNRSLNYIRDFGG